MNSEYRVVSRNLNPAEYDRLWIQFAAAQEVSYRYLPKFIEYSKSYIQKLLIDASFVLTWQNKPVAACFVPIEEFEGRRQISSNGGFVPGPSASDSVNRRLAYEEVDRIAQLNDVKKICFSLDTLETYGRDWGPWFKELGFIDCSIVSNMMRLPETEAELMHHLRKGHKSDIKKILTHSEIKVEIISASHADYAVHEKYRELHRRCAGRETRPKSTFDAQFDLLKVDNAILVGLKKQNQFIAFAYFLHSYGKIVYMSGADDPDFQGLPLYHTLVFAAMKYHRNLNFKLFELTWPAGKFPVAGYMDYLDPKLLSIARFKHGFGGDTCTHYRGVKYFSSEAASADLNRFRTEVMNSVPTKRDES